MDPIFNIPSSFHPPTADQTVGPRAILVFYCMSISRISFRTALDGKYARRALSGHVREDLIKLVDEIIRSLHDAWIRHVRVCR